MTYTDRVLQKASIRGVADYLLFGAEPDGDNGNYEYRLDKAQKRFDEKIMKADVNEKGKVLDSANELTCEVALVYAELGMQSALLIMKDMFRNLDCQTDEPKEASRAAAYDFLMRQVEVVLRMAEEDKELAIHLLEQAVGLVERMLQ